ncbi:MAG: EamA family transporter [Thermoleophilia bacterium]|nr:EamA family transporter [Gaiellaceae bacterium]MDW8339398.1 EamA family transporter [Thermoleophilia bacterium]
MADAPLPIPGALERDRRARLGTAMALGAATLFAINGSVAKLALTGSALTPLDYTQLRTTGAFLVLGLAMGALARAELRLSLADLPFLAFYGMLSFAVVQWLYFVSIERLPIGIALLLQFSGIVLVALWARLVWHERVRPRVWGALSLTLVGLALVSELWLGWSLDTVGVLAGMGAAVALAVYLLAGERAVQRRSPLAVLTLALLFASLTWAIVQPWWSFPFGELVRSAPLGEPFPARAIPVWALVVWTVLAGTIAPFALAVGALRHLPATRAGIALTLEPVAAALVAWTWLGETLSGAQVAGGLVVVSGIFLAQTSR